MSSRHCNARFSPVAVLSRDHTVDSDMSNKAQYVVPRLDQQKHVVESLRLPRESMHNDMVQS